MSTVIVGTPAAANSGASYSAASSSFTRAVVIGCCTKTSADVSNTCNTITWGSTARVPTVQFTNGVRSSTAISVFTEAEVASGGNVSSSWTTAPNTEKFFCYTVEANGGGTPSVVDSGSASEDVVTIDSVVGSVCLGFGSGRTNTAFTTTGWTENFDELLSGTDGEGTAANFVADSVTETYNIDNGGEFVACAISFSESGGGGGGGGSLMGSLVNGSLLGSLA